MGKIVVQFDFPQSENTNKETYDKIWDDLRASGNGNPDGLIFHVGAPKQGGGWLVVDVWESEQAFSAFGNVLMPIIQKNNLPMVQPVISQASYVYEAQKQNA